MNEDNWTTSIYIAAETKADLDVLVKNEAVQQYIKDYSFVQRYESIRDHEQKTVPIRID
jgi:hypothetical protein